MERYNRERKTTSGVSLTGIMDHKILSGDIYNKALLNTLLVKLKDKAVEVNKCGLNDLVSTKLRLSLVSNHQEQYHN